MIVKEKYADDTQGYSSKFEAISMPNLLTDTGADNESDSSTSSSENESLASSSSSSFIRPACDTPHVLPSETVSFNHGSDSTDSGSSSDSSDESDIEDQLPIPRKILRLRKTIYDALHCVLCIIADYSGRREADESDFGGKILSGADTLSGRGRMKGKGKGKGRGTDIESVERSTYSMGSEIVVDSWTRLAGEMKTLQATLPSLSESQQSTLIQANLNILDVLLNRIRSLARDKSYLRTISGSEARAARSIASSQYSYRYDQKSNIGREQEMSESIHEYGEIVVEDTPPLIILRLARYALGISSCMTSNRNTSRSRFRSRKDELTKHRNGYLHLSNLPYSHPMEILEHLDMKTLLNLFGIEAITHLNISGNNLPHMPFWSSSSWPFPDLVILDISNNPLLYTLPLSLFRQTINTLRRVKHRNTHLHPPDNVQILTFGADQRLCKHTSAKKLGTTTLVDQTIVVLLRYQNTLHPLDRAQWLIDQSLYLPPHLVHKLKQSWICDLCDQPQLITSSRSSSKAQYHDHFFRVGLQLNPSAHSHSSVIMFSGNLCTSCRNLYNLTDAAFVT